MRNFGLDAWVSRISTQKPCLTIPAAIGSQAKKWENGMLQEVLPVRRSHIRTVTLRAWSCSTHETGFVRLMRPASGGALAPDQSHSTTCRVSINTVRSRSTTSTLKRLLSEYISHHHEDRTHLGLEKETPGGRMHSLPSGRISSQPRLGGLHHRYDRAA